MVKRDFIGKVLLILNEADVLDKNGTSYYGAESAQIDRYIEGSFGDAWRRCVSVMPRLWFRNNVMPIGQNILTGLNLINAGSGFTTNTVITLTEDGGNEKSLDIKITGVDNSGSITTFEFIDDVSKLSIIADRLVYSVGSTSVIAKPITKTYLFPELNRGTGYVVLPNDFYVLSKFQMEGWVKAVYEASHENERVSNIQSNEYTRGSTIRPVCLIEKEDVEGEIKEVLRYYSLPESYAEHRVKTAFYVPLCKEMKEMLDDEDIEVDDRVIEPLAYITAGTVASLLSKYDEAKNLEQKALEMFPALKSVKGGNVIFKQ